MKVVASVTGCLLLAIVLTDAFNTIVLPRRAHGLQATRMFYRYTYGVYSAIGRRIKSGEWRESYLSVFGPLSLLALIALWAVAIVVAFGMLEWSAGVEWSGKPANFFDSIYLSATTLATVGAGSPSNDWLKLLTMAEGLLGLTFLGLNIGYLPVLYQSFSRRELQIAMVYGRAGSPLTSSALIRCEGASSRRLEKLLADCEEWMAQMLENHLSYPMLAYFRSHHEDQAWLTALIAIVDASAITVSCSDGDLKTQAGLTFAIGRHALADIAKIFRADEPGDHEDRLPANIFQDLRRSLAQNRGPLHLERLSQPEFQMLRKTYEPCAIGLSRHLLMAMPPWVAGPGTSQSESTVSDVFKIEKR